MIFQKIRGSLRAKLILGCVIIEAIMLFLLLNNSVRLINQATLDHAKTHLEEIPPLLNSALAPLLFQRDYAAINDFLNDIIIDDNHGISYIIIYDNSGQIYGQKGNVDIKNLPKRNDILKDKIQTEFINSEIPLMISHKKIGVVKFGISLAHLIESKNKLLSQGILIASGEILLTIFLLGLLSFILTRHIIALVKGANAMSEGNYNVKIKNIGTDEIGQLSKSFNTMASAIREQVENLRNSEQQFRSTFDQAAVGIAHVALDGRFLRINQRFCDIVGYKPEKMLELTFQNITHPDDLETNMDNLKQVLSDEIKHYSTEKRYLKKNGSIVWVNLTVSLLRESPGKPKYFISVVEDITERKLEEGKYKKTIESSIDGFWIVDIKGGFLEVNEAYSKMIGYRRDELLKMSIMDVEELEHPEETKKRIENIIRNGSDRFESKHRHKKGHIIDVEVSTTYTPDSGGLFFVFLRNITDRNRMEEQLKQAQKMESIGNLAGGIAHDFNNLLYPIIGFAEMLIEDLPPDSPEHESVQEIFKAGKRGGELVKQILAFSRQSDHRLRPVRVQNILKEVLKLARSSIPSDIEIHQDIQQDCGSVMAEATQLHQIGMNLITNAYHAVENVSGIISVQLKETVVDAGELKGSPLKPGQYAMLSVSDNGSGIPQNVMNNIFEPYFTTKEKGKGTGLGLAVVYGIVKEHKGDVKVSSFEGKGTTFNVYLPLMKKSFEAVANNQVSDLQTGTENLLLVDDEESVVRLEKQMLERLGYNVVAQLNSIDALEIFKINPDEYDLVVTDMTMPNMTGDQLAKKILEVRSDMPIIICTGFSERINKDQAEAIGVKGFLMKPVVKSEMAQMVRKVLDEEKNS